MPSPVLVAEVARSSRAEVFSGLWLDAKALFDEDRRKLIRVLKRGLRTPEHAAFAAKLAAAGRAKKPR